MSKGNPATEQRTLTAAQTDALILADRLRGEETFKEHSDFCWANSTRIVKALLAFAAAPSETRAPQCEARCALLDGDLATQRAIHDGYASSAIGAPKPWGADPDQEPCATMGQCHAYATACVKQGREEFIERVNALRGVLCFPDDLEIFWECINGK